MKTKEDMQKSVARGVATASMIFVMSIAIFAFMGVVEHSDSLRHIGVFVVSVIIVLVFWHICSPILGDLTKSIEEN